jgi:uncharacterized cupin superfamily protein
MSDAAAPNIFGDQWERSLDHGGFALRGTRVGAAAGAERLGLGVFEIPPGKRNMPYHCHFGLEELLVVLAGRPSLRSADGERTLEPGEVVSCPAGRAGLHQLINRTDAAVRYLVASSWAQADVVEYPDSGKIAARGGQLGSADGVTHILATEHQLGYFEGEPED